MAVSTDGWISLSAAAGKLNHGGTGLAAARSWKQVKFGSGEMMGKKLKMTHIRQGRKSVRKHVCMSLTTDFVADSKVRNFNPNSNFQIFLHSSLNDECMMNYGVGTVSDFE